MVAPTLTHSPTRRPGQGVGNIVRFNWPFFAMALGGAAGLLALLTRPLPPLARLALGLALAGLVVSTLVSLLVSAYVYDGSGLYRLDWLAKFVRPGGQLVSVNAGFDEASALLAVRFPQTQLTVLDFYDQARHTEPSIARARHAYPPYPGTLTADPAALPLPTASADTVLAMLAAHEVRDPAERVVFFRELARVLRPGGRIIVVEHLRDAANFLAYNIGALHFHSRAAWLATFDGAGLRLRAERKHTPFISVFILERASDAVST